MEALLWESGQIYNHNNTHHVCFIKQVCFYLFPANTGFLATVAAKYGIKRTDGITFARNQLQYALGSTGRSYVVGYGVNPPTHLHHRAS